MPIKPLLLLLPLLLLAACGGNAPGAEAPAEEPIVDVPVPEDPCTDFRAGHRNAYFGDLHTHTNLSIDAFFFNSLNGPREALRFAQGEAISLPAGDDPDTPARSVQLDRPLDFAAVTDHAESLGNFFNLCTAFGNAPADSNPACVLLGNQIRANVRSFVAGDTNALLALLQGVTAELPTTRSAWRDTQRINNEEYAPCRFSTMHAYEYTPNAFGQALHRNIFFRNDTVPDNVFSAVGVLSSFAQDNANIEWALFDHLQAECVDVDGCEVFTIAHNPNTSDGRFFRPIDPATGLPPARDNQPLSHADAELRGRLERGFEVSQHKGNSECAVGVTSDLLQGEESRCDFENFKTVCTGSIDDPAECADFCTGADDDPAFCQHRDSLYLVQNCDTVAPDGSAPENCTTSGDYLVDALTQGLAIQDRLDGINPYRMGLSASTDNHNGTPGNVREEGFTGHGGILDDEPAEQLGEWQCLEAGALDNADPADPDNCPGRLFADVSRPFNPGGLAGVWAPQNTRDALWQAIRRGETWGTSGPRLRMRMLAGWESFPADIAQRLAEGQDPDAFAELPGVAMGADLPPRTGDAPRIAAWAMQDPEGHPLQALQIVKGWVDASGEQRIRVFTIAETGDTVREPARDSCAVFAGDHPAQLAGIWQDPAFDPNHHAFYYLRALVVPSCRYNTHLCLTKDVDCGLLNPDNGIFPEATGLQGFEGCCRITEAETPDGPRFAGSPVFQTVEERGWGSPVWYNAPR
ncbi:DUF3604 domain-containing protein [Algiphilus aromaticivorans]|uniref:DUF3604 domain-containing protein n=1 Tax=Algiphilus aromaticivorans TaxID=382454 RepID=UPI0005C26334|nr:DUF3604 domain-containing protein [Algiphilus aromaticivorans]